MHFRTKLEKYFYLPYYTFKQASVYWVNNLLGVISSVILISIVYYLWSAVLKSNHSFSYSELNKTLTYVVIVTIINRIISRNIEMELGEKVINGNIATDLIRPIGFFNYMFFNRFGNTIYNLIFSILPLFITAVFIFKIKIVTDPLKLSVFLLSIILSFLLVYIFEFLVGLTSFWTSQVFGVSLLKSSLINILGGLTVPITFYPEVLQRTLFNLPFQAMYYIPAAIYLDLPRKSNLIQNLLFNLGLHHKVFNSLLEQIVWIVVISIVLACSWHLAKRKLVIQGG